MSFDLNIERCVRLRSTEDTRSEEQARADVLVREEIERTGGVWAIGSRIFGNENRSDTGVPTSRAIP
jgi:hypothetical protein